MNKKVLARKHFVIWNYQVEVSLKNEKMVKKRKNGFRENPH